MNRYTATMVAHPTQGQTKDDLLSVVVQTVDTYTIVESARADLLPSGLVHLEVRYFGLNDSEANLTGHHALRAAGTADSLRVRRT
jgi:hypothetical protein